MTTDQLQRPFQTALSIQKKETPMRLPTLALGLTAALIGGSAFPQTPAAPVPGPSMALALEAAQTSVATCKANGYNVAATVIDSAGVVRVLVAGDGAAAGPVGSSMRKANAALKYKDSSASLETKVKSDTALDAAIKADATLMARAGAQVLISKGVVIGAIGTGGAPGGDKDDVCTLAAVAKIKSRL
jgi:uncharacterized protein GlcG (DUF336 family)